MAYRGLISRWRFAFNYNVIYDYSNDHLSRIIDLVNFDLLIVGHFIVALEMIWKNRSEKIDQQILHIQYVLCDQFHRKMNMNESSSASLQQSYLWLSVFARNCTFVYNNL